MKAGWRTEPLIAVCQLINRGVSPAYVENLGVAVLNQKCIRDHSVNFDLARRHNDVIKKVTADKFLRAGDVLVNSTGTGTLGRVAQLREAPIEPTTVDSHVTVVRPKDGIFYPEFFGYALIAIEEQIQEGGEGCGGQTELARSKLANDYRVSFPEDIRTQQRIVTLLDEAFDGIATARAHAEKNLQNARAIFESHLDAVLSNSSAVYTETTLGAEVDLLPGYAFPSSGYTDATDAIRLLRGDNIMQGYFRWEEAKCWPSDDCESYSRFTLQEGDVVIAMDRPWVKAGLKRGQICSNDLPSLLVQRTSRLRTLGRMRMDFLSHLTGSQSFSRHLLKVQTGIGVPHISSRQIESFKFMLPPMSDQVTIANTLNELLLNTQRLGDIYEEKITALDALKKSLLHRAFNGDL